MPPIFYTETVEEQRQIIEGQPSPPKTRKITTRYYTELYPDPAKVLEKLFSAQSGESMPPIFYEIEDIAQKLGGKYKQIPLSAGIKPISIAIQEGFWGGRVDWVVQWEELAAEDIQEPITIAGLEIHSWTRNTTSGEQVAEFVFGHKILNTSRDIAAHYQRLRTDKPKYTITGKVIGQIDFPALRDNIDTNTSIVGFTYAYNSVTDVTDVQITLEEVEEKDGTNG